MSYAIPMFIFFLGAAVFSVFCLSYAEKKQKAKLPDPIVQIPQQNKLTANVIIEVETTVSVQPVWRGKTFAELASEEAEERLHEIIRDSEFGIVSSRTGQWWRS